MKCYIKKKAFYIATNHKVYQIATEQSVVRSISNSTTASQSDSVEEADYFNELFVEKLVTNY